MKNRQQIDAARAVMRQRLVTPGLTDLQKAAVMGVSNALQWAAGVGNSTVERLLSDEPMAPGKDASLAFERLSQLPDIFQLSTVALAALDHLAELRRAWESGAIQERDGRGGERSNRNAEIESQLRRALGQ